MFAQGTYAVTPKLAVDVGARYSHYRVGQAGSAAIGAGIPGFPGGGLVVADLTGLHNDQRITGKVSFNWTPGHGNLLYAFVARGYKPGGLASSVQEFVPETVVDYEIGWKPTLFDGRINARLGAFYYDYKNFQFPVVNPITGEISPTNLTRSTVKGIEAQAQARFGALTLDGGAAWVKSSLADVSFIDDRAVARASRWSRNGPRGGRRVLPHAWTMVPSPGRLRAGRTCFRPNGRSMRVPPIVSRWTASP